MAASFHGHSDIVRMLIDAEAEIDKQDEVQYAAFIMKKHTIQHTCTIIECQNIAVYTK